MKKIKKIIIIPIILIFTGCTQIITAPISLAGAVVGTTLDVAGSAGGAVVNTVTGGSSEDD
ncbi:MAG TPA: hypothetical protein EYG98_06495 [Sulfurovum sp.]|nr:hypothetical protein [Sulfurovum sp.]